MLSSLRRVLPVMLCLALLFSGPDESAASPSTSKNPNDNILIFWTDGNNLKAVTLMCVRDSLNPIGIVTIPVLVRVRYRDTDYTVAEAYGALGRQGLTGCLEDLFRMPVGCYVSIDQSTINKISLIIGPVSMDGIVTTLSNVFEGTYTNKPVDPQVEVRQLAARLVEPRIIVRVPELIWIISREVKTNLSMKSVFGIYRAVVEQGPGILNKKVLPGYECVAGGRKYRDVPPEAWVQTVQSVAGSL